MNYVEWPAPNCFVPLPGTMGVVSQTPDRLVIEGGLPDVNLWWIKSDANMTNRHVRAELTATNGRVDRMCRVRVRYETLETEYDQKKDRYVVKPGGKVRRRGSGGLRIVWPWLGWLAQNNP